MYQLFSKQNIPHFVKEMATAKLLPFSSILLLILLYGVSGKKLSPCNGTIAECDENSEYLMDSEINRRFLGTNKFISYDALKKDQAICKTKGQLYVSGRGCIPPASNDYSRSCTRYKRCERDHWARFMCVRAHVQVGFTLLYVHVIVLWIGWVYCNFNGMTYERVALY